MNSTRKKTILILSANPKDTHRLRPDEEISRIKDALKRSKYRENFNVETNEATTVADLRAIFQAISQEHNSCIIHFCGHGEEGKLLVEDETGKKQPVPVRELAELFKLCSKSIACVVLNACGTESQAQEISRYIPCVIGRKKDVGDSAAILFAESFYGSLGDGCPSYRKAFDFARHELGLNNIDKESLIILEWAGQELLPDEYVYEEADYKWDIFLSYDPSPTWLYRKFTPLFKKYLEQCLQEELPWKQVQIFDRQDFPVSGEDVRKTIPHALCLIAICSPPYFYSECLVQEFSIMLQREQRLGCSGLVIPINVHGGLNFPPPIREMKPLDWHEYSTLTSEANEVLFSRFFDAVRDFSRSVANLIKSPPPWNEDFYYDLTPDKAIITSLLQRGKRNFAHALYQGEA